MYKIKCVIICINKLLLLSFRTDLLKRYLGKDLKLTLPDNKKLTEISWFAVYDLSKNVKNFINSILI